MERERLFVQTVDWLAGVGSRMPPDEHELLLASGRLRLLLLDEQRLVDQVNRAHGFDIRYRILRHRGLPPFADSLLLWAVPDGLSPRLMGEVHNIPIESVGLEAFLHERVMVYKGEEVTVRDLIDHVANVVGGVHAGKARESRDEKLNELAEAMVVQGIDAPVRCLRSIVVVVADALRPLRDAVAGL